jgi:hypothetical protein
MQVAEYSQEPESITYCTSVFARSPARSIGAADQPIIFARRRRGKVARRTE